MRFAWKLADVSCRSGPASTATLNMAPAWCYSAPIDTHTARQESCPAEKDAFGPEGSSFGLDQQTNTKPINSKQSK